MELNKNGLDRYPASWILMENLALAAWIAVGAYLSSLVIPLLGIVYIAFAVIMIGFVLRKLLCTNCWYYGKLCHTGWGKLSSFFFKQGDVNNFANCSGAKLPPFVFGLLTLAPLGLGIWALVILPTQRIIVGVLILALLFLSFFSGGIARKHACAKCKMNLICPGSAAKTD